MSGFELFGVIVLFSTIGLVVVCFILYARIQRTAHFKCPYCGERFKVPAAKSFFASRSGVDKRLICPFCGKIGYMEYTHDDDYLKEQQAAASKKEEPKSDTKEEE